MEGNSTENQERQETRDDKSQKLDHNEVSQTSDDNARSSDKNPPKSKEKPSQDQPRKRVKSAAPSRSKAHTSSSRECKSSVGSRSSSISNSQNDYQTSSASSKKTKSGRKQRYGTFTSFEEVEKAYGRYPVVFRYNPVFTPRITGYSHCWNAKRWDSTYYNEHRRKVSESRPMVDTKPPETKMHLHLKLKKLQLEEERLATIERDNRILLEKMSYIMRTKGRVDNRKEYEYKSLNRERRTRELLRVTKENQDILGRIMDRKPEYDHRKWQSDWENNQRYMDNISSFPKDWWQTAPQSGAPKSRSPSRQPSRQSTSRKSLKSSTSVHQEQQQQEQRPQSADRD